MVPQKEVMHKPSHNQNHTFLRCFLYITGLLIKIPWFSTWPKALEESQRFSATTRSEACARSVGATNRGGWGGATDARGRERPRVPKVQLLEGHVIRVHQCSQKPFKVQQNEHTYHHISIYVKLSKYIEVIFIFMCLYVNTIIAQIYLQSINTKVVWLVGTRICPWCIIFGIMWRRRTESAGSLLATTQLTRVAGVAEEAPELSLSITWLPLSPKWVGRCQQRTRRQQGSNPQGNVVPHGWVSWLYVIRYTDAMYPLVQCVRI